MGLFSNLFGETVICPDCGGSGIETVNGGEYGSDYQLNCRRCGGDGQPTVKKVSAGFLSIYTRSVPNPGRKGSGRVKKN